MEASLAALPEGSVNPEKLARAAEALAALRDQLTDMRAAEIVLCPKARPGLGVSVSSTVFQPDDPRAPAKVMSVLDTQSILVKVSQHIAAAPVMSLAVYAHATCIMIHDGGFRPSKATKPRSQYWPSWVFNVALRDRLWILNTSPIMRPVRWMTR